MTENTIVEYLEGLLDEPAAQEAEQHLDDCFVCRRLIVEVAATLLDSARTATPAPSDEVVTRVTQILAARRSPSSPPIAPRDGDGDAEAAFHRAVPDILPEIAGRYRDRRVQGRGGQARVLVVWDEYMGREVALKQLRPVDKPLVDTSVRDRLRQTAENATRFLREVRIAGQLSHPSIITVHEVGRRNDGSLYYTMPLVQGRTLKEALKECDNLPARLQLLGHFVDLCHGVAYAHSRGVIHRDLKPANVMIGEYGETILLDWGLATFARPKDDGDAPEATPPLENPLAQESGPPTPSGISLGTPSYMSPEQAAGHIHQVDHRSDIWGLGAILYEILTGEPPHTGPSALQIIIAAATRSVVPVAQRCAEAPPTLGATADRALQPAPTARHPDAKDVAAEVTAFLTAHGDAPPPRAPISPLRPKGRRWLPLAAVGAGLLGLVVGFLGGRTSESTTHPVRSPAAAAPSSTDPTAARTLAAGHASRAHQLAAQKRLLEARVHAAAALRWLRSATGARGGPTPHDREGGHALRRLLTRRSSPPLRRWLWRVRGCRPGPQAAVVLLADGRHGATGCQDGRLEVWRLADGGTTLRTPSHGLAVHRLVRGPQGRLAATTADGVVAIYQPDGRLHRTLHGHRGRVRGVTFSPDGALLATSGEDDTVRLWSLATNRLLYTQTVARFPLRGLAFDHAGKVLRGVSNGGVVKRWRLGPGARTLHPLPKIQPKQARGFPTDDPRIARAFSSPWSAAADTSGLISIRSTSAKGALLAAVKGHFAPILGVVFGTKDRALYSVDGHGFRQGWALTAALQHSSTTGPPASASTLQRAQRDAGLVLTGFNLRPATGPPPKPGVGSR